MRRLAALIFVPIAVAIVVPGWSGEARRPLFGPHPDLRAEPVSLDPRDPGRRRLGALTFLDGWALSSRERAFGGFSAITVAGDRVTLASDHGGLVVLRMGGDGPRLLHAGAIPAGPQSGWEKRDRDAEAMTAAPDGRRWIGYEGANAIYRFAADGRFDGAVRPAAMAGWRSNGGAESLARLPDGRFVAISERTRAPNGTRPALVFAGDPVANAPATRFRYRPPAGFDPSDAAALPEGGLIVVNRRLRLPYRFVTTLTHLPAKAIRGGGVAAGTPIATLDAPLLHDNVEGIAIVREGDATILWLVSDDNESMWQRTLLLRFRLDMPMARAPRWEAGR